MLMDLLAVLQSTITDTAAPGTSKLIVMGICNILALLVLPRVIKYPKVGPKMVLPFPSAFNNPSVGAFLASTSAGHLLGTAAILALSSSGAL